MQLPTLYKARNVPTKQPVCAICVERTRGRTRHVGFGYGVSVWLCEGHASSQFLSRRGGRDLVLTLTELWRANGCLTAARHKAMQAHLTRLRERPPRPRPGSYAWPTLRRGAEAEFAGGASVAHVHRRILAARFVNAEPPSARTVQRWCAQRRWLHPPPRPG
jgi:hypothetical protein